MAMAETLLPMVVETKGMTEQMQNMLRQFFQGQCKGKYMLSDKGGEICIIDLDTYEGSKLRDSLKEQNANKQLILLSLHEPGAEGGVYLRKPVSIKALHEALEQAGKRISSHKKRQEAPKENSSNANLTLVVDNTAKAAAAQIEAPLERPVLGRAKQAVATANPAKQLGAQNVQSMIGTLQDVDLNDLEQIEKIQYKPDNYLHNHMHKIFAALKSDSRYESASLDTPYGSIDIYPRDRAVALYFSESKLRILSSVPMKENELSIKYFTTEHREKPVDTSMLLDMDALLWKTALWASRGRVPAGVSIDTPIQLRNWPNLTRMTAFPHAVRIAALWAKAQYSLRSTIEILDIPQRYIFAFYSAAQATDLLYVGAPSTTEPVAQAPVQTHKKRGLLQRILGHLR